MCFHIVSRTQATCAPATLPRTKWSEVWILTAKLSNRTLTSITNIISAKKVTSYISTWWLYSFFSSCSSLAPPALAPASSSWDQLQVCNWLSKRLRSSTRSQKWWRKKLRKQLRKHKRRLMILSKLERLMMMRVLLEISLRTSEKHNAVPEYLFISN